MVLYYLFGYPSSYPNLSKADDYSVQKFIALASSFPFRLLSAASGGLNSLESVIEILFPRLVLGGRVPEKKVMTDFRLSWYFYLWRPSAASLLYSYPWTLESLRLPL